MADYGQYSKNTEAFKKSKKKILTKIGTSWKVWITLKDVILKIYWENIWCLTTENNEEKPWRTIFNWYFIGT